MPKRSINKTPDNPHCDEDFSSAMKDYSEAVQEHYALEVADNRKDRRTTRLTALLTICGVLLTTAIGFYVSIKGIDEAERHRQIMALHKIIDQKITYRKTVITLINDVRVIVYNAQRRCSEEKYPGDVEKVKEDIIKKRSEFAREGVKASGLYAEVVEDRIRQYVKRATGFENICDKAVISDDILHQGLRDVNGLMIKTINKDKHEVTELMKGDIAG